MPSPPDAIRFLCPKCNYRIKVAVDFAGKPGKCPGCLAPIRVPDSSLIPAGSDSTRERRDPADAKRKPRAGRRGADKPKERAPREPEPAPRQCPGCGQESPAAASECAGCGRPLGYPDYVNTVFTVSGWSMVALGVLNGLNAVLMLVGSKGGALIPATIVGVVGLAMGRIGWGLREKNKLSLGVAAAIGCLALLLQVPLAFAALQGANIYLAPGIRLSTPVVFLSLFVTLGVYLPPLVLGVRFRREIEWS